MNCSFKIKVNAKLSRLFRTKSWLSCCSLMPSVGLWRKTQCRGGEGHLSLQHQQEVQVLREELAREQERANLSALDISALKTLHQQELNSLMQEAQDARSLAEQLEAKVQVLEENRLSMRSRSECMLRRWVWWNLSTWRFWRPICRSRERDYKRRRKRKRRGLRSSGKKSKRAMRRC